MKVDALCGPAGGVLNTDEQPNTPPLPPPPLPPLYYYFFSFYNKPVGEEEEKEQDGEKRGSRRGSGQIGDGRERGGRGVGFVGGWGGCGRETAGGGNVNIVKVEY